MDRDEGRRRWQLILGQEAREPDGEPLAELSNTDQQIDQALDFLFGRDRAGQIQFHRDRDGSRGESVLSVPRWLTFIRELFPQSTAEMLTRVALERYQLTEVLADEETLNRMEPNRDLLRALLAVKSLVPGNLLSAVRRVVRRVVEELREKLETRVRQHFAGSLHRRQPSPLALAKNFDVARTIRKNLKHFDPADRRLMIERAYFFSRLHRKQPWDVVLVVDQSGSMADSVIHATVMASIFHSLPNIRCRLVVFDTSVVDLSDITSDPVELLMKVQLGGGTDIAPALEYARSLVVQPRRTILVLVTDFFDFGEPRPLKSVTAKLASDGVVLLGLAALDDRAKPAYCEPIARSLAKIGMTIAAMTPDRLAEWVAERVRA